MRLARTIGLETDAGEQLGIIIKAGDLMLGQLFGAQRLNADRHLLQAFLALLRGDDDFGIFRNRGGLLGQRRVGREAGAAKQHGNAKLGEWTRRKPGEIGPHDFHNPDCYIYTSSFAQLLTRMQARCCAAAVLNHRYGRICQAGWRTA